MKPNNLGKIIAEINGLITMTEMAMSANGDKTRLYNLKKEINRRLKLLNTRPKPSVKWPQHMKNECSKKHISTISFGECVECAERASYNRAIDACQSAVEAAGLEYGVDEENFKNLKMVRDLIDGMLYKGHIIHEEKTAMLKALDIALKLAERELIVRKEK